MDFANALEAMKYDGAKVRRVNWNGKGMWVCLNGGHADVLPYFVMKTADNKILMGWLASQTDLLADDWEVAE